MARTAVAQAAKKAVPEGTFAVRIGLAVTGIDMRVLRRLRAA
jgi:hypothetical protein